MTWVLVVLSIFAIWKIFALFVFPRILERWFTSHHQLTAEEGYVAITDQSRFLGREGTAVCDLKPSGRGRFDGETVDVTAEHGFVERGSPIIVTEIRAGNVIVSKKDKVQGSKA
ncbi:MAG: NfeD family protein [Candidatus Ozemobacteraceae bacterium]